VNPTFLALLLLFTACVQPAQAASAADDHFAEAQRAHYAALCRARKDLDSCSDAVRWNPGDPALVVALADALARARRLPEAIRDYRRAAELEPSMHGLDAKISAAEAKLTERRPPRKPATDSASANEAAGKRYSNADPEAQSH
jgi:tetratricopeptide (TPR) repeat protein